MFLTSKKWVKNIQTAGYNGARTVYKRLNLDVRVSKFVADHDSLLTQSRYRTRAIISRGLYIFYPIFKDHFFVFKEVF